MYIFNSYTNVLFMCVIIDISLLMNHHSKHGQRNDLSCKKTHICIQPPTKIKALDHLDCIAPNGMAAGDGCAAPFAPTLMVALEQQQQQQRRRVLVPSACLSLRLGTRNKATPNAPSA